MITTERSTGLIVVSAVFAALTALAAIFFFALESESKVGGLHIVSIGMLCSCALCILCLLLSTFRKRVAAGVVGIIAGLSTLPIGLLLVGFSIASLRRKIR